MERQSVSWIGYAQDGPVEALPGEIGGKTESSPREIRRSRIVPLAIA